MSYLTLNIWFNLRNGPEYLFFVENLDKWWTLKINKTAVNPLNKNENLLYSFNSHNFVCHSLDLSSRHSLMAHLCTSLLQITHTYAHTYKNDPLLYLYYHYVGDSKIQKFPQTLWKILAPLFLHKWPPSSLTQNEF